MIQLFSRGSFRHGIHPPELKEETRAAPIRELPFAPSLIVPLLQHAGKPAIPLVHPGQRVTRGERIAEPDGFLSVAMHAPVSGTVRRIAPAPSLQGRMLPAIYIETQPGSTQEIPAGEACELRSASASEILSAIQRAGIVGLGGAAFPTHAKLSVASPARSRRDTSAPSSEDSPRVDTLILNGAECEPYLTTDHRVMLEQSADVFTGIRYLLRATGVSQVILAVEANKQDAAAHLRETAPTDLPLRIEALPVKYPQGAEKLLIRALLGREVPTGELPVSVRALVVNVATAAEIGRLLPLGRGSIERVVTVTGSGVTHKGNYRIAIGTPLRFVLEQVGARHPLESVYVGGPMMGVAASSLDIPLTKGACGVIATRREHARPPTVYPCIRCGRCVDVCPMFLDPSRLLRLARNGRFDEMVERDHLLDCFECGSCSYVCPSQIPLVQHFRVAKASHRREQAP